MKKILSFLLWLFITAWLCIINTDFVFATWDKSEDVGITLTITGCLDWVWQNCFDYEKLIWIDDDQPDYTATSIAQDVVVSATYMVWTVLTIIILICWLWYIFSSTWGKGLLGKSPSDYKSWLIKAAIWAILVRWAYAIVRLIQYIAQW